MPDSLPKTRLPALSSEEVETRAGLERHVDRLAGSIGGRSASKPANLRLAGDYIANHLSALGYRPRRQPYEAKGLRFENIDAGPASAGAMIVIGAHYDTAGGLPG